MLTRFLAAVALCGLCSMAAAAVNVKLTVTEEAGVGRVANPVNSGVPLPKGAVTDVASLRLLDAAGKPVLASIKPRCRWLGDDSLKWVTVHFLATVPAKGSLTYTLTDAAGPKAPGGPIQVINGARAVVVTTGPARFHVAKDRLAPFRQVYLRSDATKDFAEADALLAGPAVVRLVGRNGEARVVNKRSQIVGVGDAFRQTGLVMSTVIEERGPARVVVALKGTFSTKSDPSLDFTARLYFYANSPLAQMTFSVRNRQLKSMARFVGIERLAVEMPLKKGAQAPLVSYAVDGKTHQRPLTGARPVTLFQSARNKLTVTLPDGATAEGATSPGWVQVNTGGAVFTAGNRWFLQTYPKGLAVAPSGAVALDLAPAAGKRVDLFTAGAKTHFLFFHVAKPGAGGPAAPGRGENVTPEGGRATPPESVAAGTTHPLVARCDPNWYCQETRVFGDLCANNPALFDPKYRDVIKRYQARIDQCIRQIVKQRSRETWTFGVDEYGWLDFGSGFHHRTTTKNTSEESWWDSNYYDFPHAAIVNYVRTGDLIDLTTAEEAGLHLADIDICHSFPGRPERAGSPRSGPVIGHFRNYAGDTRYMGHDSFTFYKNESLYELYYLTGERWYHEVGRMSSDFAISFFRIFPLNENTVGYSLCIRGTSMFCPWRPVLRISFLPYRR